VATFNYMAKSGNGKVSVGKIDATDKNMAVSLLKNKGMYLLEISELSILDRNVNLRTGKKISAKDLALFCRQFYTMIDAGVTVIGSLDLLRRQTENRKLARVLGNVYEDVQKGMALSEAMGLHKNEFPNIVISMIEIGEISGNLDVVLDRLSIYLEKDNKVRQKIKTSMVYPKVICAIAIVAVIFMMTFVVPNFINMFKTMGSTLPLPTRILISISNLFKNIWFILGSAIAIPVLIFSFKKYTKTENGKYLYDKITLDIPVVGKYMKKIIASRFSRSLSLLLKTGVPIIQSLEVVGNLLNNEVVNRKMVKVKEDIKRGSGLAEPLEAVGIFPLMVTHMISIGEEAGSLDSIVDKVADFYDDELEASIVKLLAILEPLMIVAIALIIGGIVIAMILPMFSIYKNVM
jgi:type IV pilus assembly protein PilC